MFDIPNDQIGSFPFFENPAVIKSEGFCGIPGHPGQCFFGSHTEQGAAHVHHQKQRLGRRTPGIAVRGKCDRDVVLPEQIQRRKLSFPEKIEGSRQEIGNRPDSAMAVTPSSSRYSR